MKKYIHYILILFFSISSLYLHGQQKQSDETRLPQEYNLIPKHSMDTQYYVMESRLLKYGSDGTRLATDIYRLYLRCVPANKTSAKGDEYTCLKFVYQSGNSQPVTIPSLTNWKYFFSLNARDDKGQVLGIDHSKFEHLVDEAGNNIPLENTYHAYNAFIDFHSMSVFAEKTDSGKGVQDLKKIGDKIIHAASFSKPSVSLGSKVEEGSYFKNGEITLAFKGISLVNRKACALLGYDSGESSFYMLTMPLPNMEVKTKGSSHYQGDIYKDLDGGWIQKATLHELVVSETIVPGMANKINSVIERSIQIDNVNKINM